MMEHQPMKITFHMDGAGVFYNPVSPISLDALLGWVLATEDGLEPPGQNELPVEIQLPLKKWEIGGEWGWHASVLFPDGHFFESQQIFRKRFRENKIDITKGVANRVSGPFKDCQLPIPLLVSRKMVAYANGDIFEVEKILKEVHYLGKMASMGKGRVIAIDVYPSNHDYSLVKNGKATRFLPMENGPRVIRPRPPYWNGVGKCRCCQIGEVFSLS